MLTGLGKSASADPLSGRQRTIVSALDAAETSSTYPFGAAAGGFR
jgi:hypothetical protein